MKELLERIERKSEIFRLSLNAALDRSRFDRARRENEINRFVIDFRDAANRLTNCFNNRQAVENDVREALNRATFIDSFIRRERLDARAQNDWSSLRADLDQLASAWRINWRWDNQAQYPPGYGYSANRLAGTWRLNASQSDNARAVAQRATRNLNLNERQRVQENLMRRLEAPNTLAIDRRGRTVTLASSRAPQVTFEADGRESVETLRNGRERRTRATLSGELLVVRSVGDRGSYYEVIFEPLNGGRTLRVTRTLYSERFNQAIVSRSVYDRVSDVAQLNLYRDLPDYSPAASNFIVPDGTRLTARLNQQLSAKQTWEGDRFTMSVTGSGQYNGAVIEGVVTRSDRSGRLTGRSDMTLDFDRIRLRDGRVYNFAGTINRVQLPNGETVRVDREGNVEEDDSQTSRTVTRSAIGGAIGAIIGAIAGVGKGAAIGAAIGAGAWSVFIEGRDDLELPAGTEFFLRASAPR